MGPTPRPTRPQKGLTRNTDTPAYSLKIVDEVLRAYEGIAEINVFDPFCGTGTTPAYSLKIVDEVLRAYEGIAEINVFDPFCGTGTTALCAGYRGHTAVTVEINPFLVWFSRTKTDSYSTQVISELNQHRLAMRCLTTSATAGRRAHQHRACTTLNGGGTPPHSISSAP